jgi:hypothetical protein
VITEDNLSIAWVKAFAALTVRGVEEVSPLVVSVVGMDGAPLGENPAIESALDGALLAAGKFSCHTVANTIFPCSMWNPAVGRSTLFARYGALLTRLKRVPQNRQGTYFGRLIRFGPEGTERNQLEHIISTYERGNHRRSALQASIFDPMRDQTHQRQRGFPCLQQVAFLPQGDGGLCVTGFYGMQYLFDRGYGNYLGLSRLGTFMAHELGLRLTQMVCVAAVAQRGIGIGVARHLRDQLADIPGAAEAIQMVTGPREGGQA